MVLMIWKADGMGLCSNLGRRRKLEGDGEVALLGSLASCLPRY